MVLFLREGFSLNLELSHFARLAGQEAQDFLLGFSSFHHQATFLVLLLSFLAASHHRSGLQQSLAFP